MATKTSRDTVTGSVVVAVGGSTSEVIEARNIAGLMFNCDSNVLSSAYVGLLASDSYDGTYSLVLDTSGNVITYQVSAIAQKWQVLNADAFPAGFIRFGLFTDGTAGTPTNQTTADGTITWVAKT